MNPQLGAAMQNPMMRAMLTNPETLRRMTDPANMQAMAQMQQAMQTLQGSKIVKYHFALWRCAGQSIECF